MPSTPLPQHQRRIIRRLLKVVPGEQTNRGPSNEVAAAVVLMAATVVALVWANLPESNYHEVWTTQFELNFDSVSFGMDLHHWINDALMALFFAFLTLEVRREIEMGELRDRRRAAVPVAAAVVGLALPAALFLLVNMGTGAASGWGVVVSTDTAFVLGILALVGRRMPPQLRVFLVTLAVADDIGALAIIALFYTDDLEVVPILVAVAALMFIALLRRLGVWRGAVYLAAAVVVWVALYESGIHATLAGVAIALLLPIFPTSADHVDRARRLMSAFAQSPSPDFARQAEDRLQRAVSVNERAHRRLLPYVSFVVLPLFALANAGVHISGPVLRDAFTSRLTWGIIIGLVVGKTAAIALTAAVARRLRPGSLGPGLGLSHIGAIATLSGIGFTLALFVADLAFADSTTLGRAQIGILSASLIAAVIGTVFFRVLDRLERARPHLGTRLAEPVNESRDHIRGNVNAPLTLVVYGSFACGLCASTNATVEELRNHFGDRLRVVFRHFPAGKAFARDLSLASEVAAQQGRFWEFSDAVFADQPIGNQAQIMQAASRAGLNLRLFRESFAGRGQLDRVELDENDAAAMGLAGTPAIFIQNVLYDGPRDTDSLINALDAHDVTSLVGYDTRRHNARLESIDAR